MKRIYFLILHLFLVFSLFAQIPDGYYSSASGKTGAALKTELYTIISGHTSLSYSGLWGAFYDTDAKSNGKVWDMYSDIPNGTPPYEYTFGNNQCGNYNSENDCYNREHSFPKSWFADATPMYSDLFHLYPTDGYVNGKRSNYPFGEVGTATWTSLNGSKLGSSNYPGYSGVVFEPIDEYKGDFARTYFYMATRYENLIANWTGNGLAGTILAGNSYPAYKEWVINMLIEWHNADPVDEKEINRNNAVYVYQNNRNPFIDHPHYVNQIWGTPVDESVNVSSIAQLRQQSADGTTIYSITNEVYLTFQQSHRNKKYVQDPNGIAAIEIDDNLGVITNSYNVLDGISNLKGTLQLVNEMLTFIPVENTGVATSTNNVVVPEVKTLNQLTLSDQGRLIKILDVTFNITGIFENGINYPISDASGESVFRTQFYDVDYIGTAIPSTQRHITGIFLQHYTTNEIVARNLADFQIPSGVPTYTLTLVTNPTSVASELIGNGYYSENDNVYISAGLATGYSFTNWSGAADVLPLLGSLTSSSTSFLMPNKNVTLTANYEVIVPDEFTLNVSIVGGGNVTVNGTTYLETQTFNENEIANLKAISQNGWQFSGWSGDVTSTNAITSVLMTSNKNITAIFVEQSETLEDIVIWNFEDLNTTADGGIATNLDRVISTNTEGEISFPAGAGSGASVSSTSWDNGSNSKYWIIDFSTLGYNSISFSSKQRSSNTGPKDFKVQYKLETSEWIDVLSSIVTVANNFTDGQLIDISLPQEVSDVNKVYLRWIMTSNTAVNGSAVALSGTSRMDDIVIRGMGFSSSVQHTLTINTIGEGSVTVGGVDYSTPIIVDENTILDLVATSASGWEFSGWTGTVADIEESTTTVTMNANKTITATFTEIPTQQYTLIISTIGNGSVKVNGIDYSNVLEFNEGTVVNLIAIAEENNLFVQWTGDLQSENATIPIVMNQDKSITANFRPVISAVLEPNSGAFNETEPTNVSTVITWNDASEVVTIVAIVEGDEYTLIEDEDYFITAMDGATSQLTFIMMESKSRFMSLKGEFDIVCTVNFDMGLNAIFTIDYAYVDTYTVWFTIQDEVDDPVSNAVIIFGGTELPMGAYSVENIETGSYPYSVSKNGYQTASGTVEVIDGDVQENVVLHKLYIVSFKVSSIEGPLVNVQIKIADQTLNTDASGLTSILLLNGDHNYTIEHEGYSTINDIVSVNSANIDVVIVLSPVGIESSEWESIKLFPNPVEDILRIEREGNQPVVLEIYSSLGVLHFTQKWSTNSLELNVSGYKPGVYMARFAGSTIEYLKFIKQ
ncbi:MAG: endonuclease [Salinivirgaceae bacterium]|nr:endonuclease [Salinivirgaceae bacterium]